MAAPVLAGPIVGTPGESAFTAASPEFVTVKAAVKLSPRGRFFGMASAADSAGGVCTITVGEVAGAEETCFPSIASVPLAVPLNATVPRALPA